MRMHSARPWIGRLARPAFLAFVGLLLLTAGRGFGFDRLLGPPKGDEATYIAAALSIAFDGDVKYTPADAVRFVRVVGHAPDGVYLKRRYHLSITRDWQLTRVPIAPVLGLAFGKSLAYSVCAAPFVRVAGAGGFVAFNCFLLVVCVFVVASHFYQANGTAGIILGATFILASVVPLYAVWRTPDLFTTALLLTSYLMWRRQASSVAAGRNLWRLLVMAICLGLAAYSKPPLALLWIPPLADLLRRKLFVTAAIVASLTAVAAGAPFLLTLLADGHWNYQGSVVAGDRKYFGPSSPFDAQGTTFDNSGISAVNRTGNLRGRIN